MALRRWIGLVGRALVAVPLLANAASAKESWIDFALNDAGEVHLAPHTLAANDYVLATYAERLEDVALPDEAQPRTPGALPAGCLPVVNIATALGLPQLPRKADLVFGCSDLPPNAHVFAWINHAWRPLMSDRRPDGRLHVSFTQATVYGIFLVSDVPRI